MGWGVRHTSELDMRYEHLVPQNKLKLELTYTFMEIYSWAHKNISKWSFMPIHIKKSDSSSVHEPSVKVQLAADRKGVRTFRVLLVPSPPNPPLYPPSPPSISLSLPLSGVDILGSVDLVNFLQTTEVHFIFPEQHKLR